MLYFSSAFPAAHFGLMAEAAQESEYIVFSTDFYYAMVHMIKDNLGSIFSVALFLFISVLGVFVVFDLVDKMGR